MKRKILDSLKILKNAILNFPSNDPIGMAGTTAFFATFSIAPILIIVTAIIGFFTGDAGLREKLFNELSFLIGSESSSFLENVINNYEIVENSRIGAIFGGIVFLISATTFFSVIQQSTNYIWRVKVKSKIKQNLLKFLKDRVFSFGMILSLGLILLVSFVIDASVSLLKDFICL